MSLVWKRTEGDAFNGRDYARESLCIIDGIVPCNRPDVQSDINRKKAFSSFTVLLEVVNRIVMFQQHASRSPRTKGFRVKHAFQLTLLLAVGIWFLYQIKQSPYTNNDDDENSVSRLSKGNGITRLGRKEKLVFNNGVETDTDNRNFEDAGEREEDGGGGDEHEELEENATRHEEGEGEKQQEGRHEDDEEENGDGPMNGGDEGFDLDKDISEEKNDEKEEKSNDEDNADIKMNSGDEAEDSDKYRGEERDTNGGTVGSIAVDRSEMRNETQEFMDENGAPKEGTLNEIKTVDQEMSSDPKTISDPESPTDRGGTVMTESGKFSNSSLANKQNDAGKQTNDKTIKKETVQTQGGDDAIEGSKTGTSSDGETNSTSETTEGDHRDSASSTPLAPPQEKEGELDLKTHQEEENEDKNPKEI
ncbi:uncharacterized protein LOC131249325 [Magnolia sinica]|uniref:uncharacterized protein LOC131249325 n=1 Tax=Magnolia sinica TaxID=86752 RepID=UPI00265A334A|nr:uncharacterized protein LOC131249325 [Magnolia sinica]